MCNQRVAAASLQFYRQHGNASIPLQKRIAVLQQKPQFAPVCLGPPSTCFALSFHLSGFATTSSHQRTAFTNCSPPLCPIVKLRCGYQIEKSSKDNWKLRRWRRNTMKEKRTAIRPPHAIWSTIIRWSRWKSSFGNPKLLVRKCLLSP